HVGREPEGAPIEEMGFGWRNSMGSGKGGDTITSGIEGAWKPNPTTWDNGYFEMLFKYEWELGKSPAGAWQWFAKDVEEQDMIPDAHDPSKKHRPMMTTADLSLRFDPVYEQISRRFLNDHNAFADAFSRAWFKLTHRDMGPRARYLGPEVPADELIWQDPLPAANNALVSAAEIEQLKNAIRATGVSTSDLASVAWASASTFRGSDMRGGANGARINLAPQRDWEANQPQKLAGVISALEKVRSTSSISLADLIVLGGCVAIEDAAKAAGHSITVPFTPGRVDATQAQTDVESFGVLEPLADGFRNFVKADVKGAAEEFLVDKAQLLTLTAPEMTVLVGGLRVLNVTVNGATHGVLTHRAGSLTNDFFVNLLDMATEWRASTTSGIYEGVDRKTGAVRWTGTRADLVFGSNSELRALAEVYACDDAQEKFVRDFVTAWNKVMNLDRFDLA
ncbi:MAG: catalase-peroxidase, partial [Candidatus Kapabacteria bacterium]|nr:catalase-peroxidase [Candidatus Kapabacteria bacterium]